VHTTGDGQPRSRTLLNGGEPRPTDLESVLGAIPAVGRSGRGGRLLEVSDSGSEMGAASRAHVRLGAVNLTASSALTSSYNPHQVCYSNVRAVRDEEAAAGEE
jgi:hypothetical protein